MSEQKKTLAFVGAALVLALVAFAVKPSRITPDAFLDQGELFFPDFTDPNMATTLEVIDFDPATGAAHPFKVSFANGRWTIPSHHDYPADGADRLAQTAAGVIDIRKDDFRSDNVSDHESCGVLDPLDESKPGLSGHGQRVTLKGSNSEVLADFIIGKKIEGSEGLRFVRVPDQKRVYAARMDIDISTNFADWIETDLLQVETAEILAVALNDYSINERTGSVEQGDNFSLSRSGTKWIGRQGSKSFEVDSTKMAEMLGVIDSLSIVGVRPKPAGLSASLQAVDDATQMSQTEAMSLRSKGYYMTRDGKLMSNEGELKVQTSQGISYLLRFGEVLHGSGMAVSAGNDDGQNNKSGPAENRYLFLTAEFNAALMDDPPRPADMSFQDKADSVLTELEKRQKLAWDKYQEFLDEVEVNRKRCADINARFADWYYVISAADFDKLNLGRKELEQAKS